MAENTEKPIRELAKDHGLSQGLIRHWQQRYRADEATAMLQLSSEREAKMGRLQRELEIATQEQKILKKRSRFSHGSSTHEVPVYRHPTRCVPGRAEISSAGHIA